MTIHPESSSRRHVVPACRNVAEPAGHPSAASRGRTLSAVARGHVSRVIVAGMGLVALGACATDAPTSALTGRDAPLPTALSTLMITPPRESMYVGEWVTLFLRATNAAGDEEAANIAATWSTSDTGVATAEARGSRETAVAAMRPGLVTITATLLGRSASRALTIRPLPDASSSLLSAEAFRMIEFQYPSTPDQWFYAPEMRLRGTGNKDGAVVTRMTFLIPGLDAELPCTTGINVGANSAVQIFNEIHGDFRFTLAQSGVRSTGGEATAIITVTDGRGVTTDIAAKGPIVSGKLPQSYPSGGVALSCF